jgi:hypothetical protein
MLAMIPLVGSQSALVQAQGGAKPAVFSYLVEENMVLEYKITDLEFVGGGTSGNLSIGYSPASIFQGAYQLPVAENDIIRIKVDTRAQDWEDANNDTTLLYSGWDMGFSVWGLTSNITLFPGGNAPTGKWIDWEIAPVLSRICTFPLEQLIQYEPQDGEDYSAYMKDMFGDWDDNGTIDLGEWTGEGYNLTTNLDYDPNCTWYNYYDSLYAYYGYNETYWLNQVAFNKIPATFGMAENYFGNNVKMAYWNYSEYDMGYTYYNAGYFRWTSWAYVDGLFPNNQLIPYIQVTTDTTTGLTESYEFYFEDDSAWMHEDVWNGTHPITDQITKMKVELDNITWEGGMPVLPSPGFEIVTVAFVGIVLGATIVAFRKRK